MRTSSALVAIVLAGAGAAQAQDDGLAVSAGLKAWHANWSGFTYTAGATQFLVTPVEAKSQWVWIPSASLRWGSLVASISGYGKTGFDIVSGGTVSRDEADLNLAWLVTPGLALSAGYKRASQVGAFSYKPAGPVLGVSASAPLGGTLALYGNLGFGRLKTPAQRSATDVDFKVGYQLGEVGLSWALPVDRFVGALNLTLGYRTQVLVSKDAGFGIQQGLDGRDLTQGFTLGLIARF